MTVSPGLSVEVGDIDRQLGLLWKQSDAGKVRASLVNLVIYSESPEAIAANTPLLSEIAADHAFRAVLVQAQPEAQKSAVRAWITAHCHRRETGKKEICSEQITFQLDGLAAARLPSIVFSHLDTDLPLYLWWQGDLHPEPDSQLWRWVDRLIVDSNSWSDPAAQFRILREIQSVGRTRAAFADLNWTRLFHLRYAVAQIFDLPAALDRIDRIDRVDIVHASGHRLTALQLVGWLASRLGWSLDHGNHSPVFRRRDGGTVTVRLDASQEAKACVASIEIGLGDATASERRETGGDYYLGTLTAPNQRPLAQMLPAERVKTSDILLSELSRISRHPLFWPALRAIEPLLPRP